MLTSEDLMDHLIAVAAPRRRVVFAIAGPPGAGKSTIAAKVCAGLQTRGASSRVVPMDGFHLDNQILGPRGLLPRKGAPETFDALGFLTQMRRLSKGDEDVAIPVFDRDRDIAIAGAEVISQQERILIVEGNYLLLNDEPWSELRSLWTDSLMINPGMDVLETRLVQRWVDQGMSGEDAHERAMSNDIPNAQIVLSRSAQPTLEMTAATIE